MFNLSIAIITNVLHSRIQFNRSTRQSHSSLYRYSQSTDSTLAATRRFAGSSLRCHRSPVAQGHIILQNLNSPLGDPPRLKWFRWPDLEGSPHPESRREKINPPQEGSARVQGGLSRQQLYARRRAFVNLRALHGVLLEQDGGNRIDTEQQACNKKLYTYKRIFGNCSPTNIVRNEFIHDYIAPNDCTPQNWVASTDRSFGHRVRRSTGMKQPLIRRTASTHARKEALLASKKVRVPSANQHSITYWLARSPANKHAEANRTRGLFPETHAADQMRMGAPTLKQPGSVPEGAIPRTFTDDVVLDSFCHLPFAVQTVHCTIYIPLQERSTTAYRFRAPQHTVSEHHSIPFQSTTAYRYALTALSPRKRVEVKDRAGLCSQVSASVNRLREDVNSVNENINSQITYTNKKTDTINENVHKKIDHVDRKTEGISEIITQ
ncbi:hypothetical protein PR048_017704 [Dryococelus australis]|uniref:Uncharacterized protein n=1 Tax=Dryococelus australis TaxID=614101 RepID=A0ABQ9HAH5_9NEOP|nr:hypothetical protein PR048_017704 [Dryococelus australis]